MTEEQGLSAENRRLVQLVVPMVDTEWETIPLLRGELNALLDAARSEGRAKPPQDVGADSGLAAADDNRRDVPRDEEGRDAYQIIADGNRQAMLRRAGVKDRSREPLLGPPSDMLVSRILLEALPDVDPKRADQLAVKINDALPADDNHKALVEAVARHVFMGALKYAFGHDARTSDRPTLEQREATIQRLSAEALSAFQSRQEGK